MNTSHCVLSNRSLLAVFLTLTVSYGQAADTKVIFDIPSKVECKDVTPEKCAKVHPHHKVIEARFRISAAYTDGGERLTEDFVYMISSPDLRLKLLDYLPNTTLESSTADDRIEVTDTTENTDTLTGEAHVSYKVLTLGATKNLNSKKLESNHYERVAPKNLVLASGTINRGHGVFYKLRPSAGLSLEGSKEFVLLCIVPKSWRGDWCVVTCSARAHKKQSSSTLVQAGVLQAHVGLFMLGEDEASQLSDELTQVQLNHDGLLSKQLSSEAAHSISLMHSSTSDQLIKRPATHTLRRMVGLKRSSKVSTLEAAKTQLLDLEDQLRDLSGHSRIAYLEK